MGLMMWFMAKGMRPSAKTQARPPDSLEDLRAEHRRLGDEIERLQRDSPESSSIVTRR